MREVVVELLLEAGRIPAVVAALLDALAQRLEQPIEIGLIGLGHDLRMYRSPDGKLGPDGEVHRQVVERERRRAASALASPNGQTVPSAPSTK